MLSAILFRSMNITNSNSFPAGGTHTFVGGFYTEVLSVSATKMLSEKTHFSKLWQLTFHWSRSKQQDHGGLWVFFRTLFCSSQKGQAERAVYSNSGGQHIQLLL